MYWELQSIFKESLRRDSAHTYQWGFTELNLDEATEREIIKDFVHSEQAFGRQSRLKL